VLIGIIGIPVFSGFGSGLGAILGPTGGFILAFIPCSICVSLITHKVILKKSILLLGMLFGTLLCYILGVFWFIAVYTNQVSNTSVGIMSAVGYCVIPFIIPDTLKLLLSMFTVKRLSDIKQRLFNYL
jgi:biotin transport system substrate-specific component